MTAAPVLRLAGGADLDRVLQVHALHNPAERGTGPATPREAETWTRMQRTADLSVYLAEIEGDPVATASVMVVPNITYSCAPTAFIEAVVVIPAQRRRGIATMMLQRILTDVAAAGCDKVQLLSHACERSGRLMTSRLHDVRRARAPGPPVIPAYHWSSNVWARWWVSVDRPARV